MTISDYEGVILKIYHRLDGITPDDLTTAERQILGICLDVMHNTLKEIAQ